MRLNRLFVAFVLSLVSFAVHASPQCFPSDDVLASLQCIEGTTVAEVVPSTVAGYRQFEITLDQPVQHGAAGTPHFQQRLVLLHRGWEDPMVLQTSGYQIFSVALSRLARTFGANQIQVEHRYFATSTPAVLDWTHLNIAESAADFHHVTTAFKQLYAQRWVGTGASKGGMTSSYHRRYYPNDLDGTVADVAPLSFSTEDDRFVAFVNAAGGERYAECRAKLESLQLTIMARYDAMLAKIDSALVFDHLGSAEVALEHAVVELPFAFWQYGNPESPTAGCAAIPGTDATDDEVFAFLDATNGPSGYSDESFTVFQSYYFQAGTQLGGPGAKLDHLTIRRHGYSLAQYMPAGVRYTYSNSAMRDVEEWVRNEATGMMFIYGEFDPWSGGAYPRGENADMHQYVAPGANHGAKFNMLGDADKAAAIATLTQWFDRAPVEVETESAEVSLDDLELAAKRQLRLP